MLLEADHHLLAGDMEQVAVLLGIQRGVQRNLLQLTSPCTYTHVVVVYSGLSGIWHSECQA